MKKALIILNSLLLVFVVFSCKKGQDLKGIYQRTTKFPNKVVMTETMKLSENGKYEEIELTTGPDIKTKPMHKHGKWEKDGDFLVLTLEKIIQKWKILKFTDKALALKLWESKDKQGGYLVKDGISVVTGDKEKTKVFSKKQ